MVRSIVMLGMIASLGSAASAEAGGCLELRVPVAAGSYLTLDTTAEVVCRETQPGLPLRYDREARAPLATEDLLPGTYLGRIVLERGDIVGAGDRLELVIRDGPVTILRDVVATQAVRDGGRVFVKTGDGKILPARFVSGKDGK